MPWKYGSPAEWARMSFRRMGTPLNIWPPRSLAASVTARSNRVVTVLNGIDARRFKRNPAARGAARAAFGLRESELAIGAVGDCLHPQ